LLRPAQPGPSAAALLAILLATGLAAVGCASDSDVGARAGRHPGMQPLTAVDWSTRTYPSACFTPTGTEPVTVHDYRATGPDGILTMTVAHPVFGDVNGDGVADAAVTYRCIGANASPDTLLVYIATPAGPRLAATLLHGQELYVQSIRLADERLAVTGLGYSAGAPHCCPDETVELGYRWTGGRLVLDRQQRTPRPQS